MSDDFYKEQFWKGLSTSFGESMRSLGLPEYEVVMALAKMKEAFDSHMSSEDFGKLERHALVRCLERILNRQASIEPDFEELYERKSELDRKFDDPRP